jgi:hypothetical protein
MTHDVMGRGTLGRLVHGEVHSLSRSALDVRKNMRTSKTNDTFSISSLHSWMCALANTMLHNLVVHIVACLFILENKHTNKEIDIPFITQIQRKLLKDNKNAPSQGCSDSINIYTRT